MSHPTNNTRYFIIYAVLMVLLVFTVAAAYVELGQWGIVLAVSIAVLKAILVVLFFMHVFEGTTLTWVFAGGGFFWLFILFGLTLNDYLSRHWMIPYPANAGN